MRPGRGRPVASPAGRRRRAASSGVVVVAVGGEVSTVVVGGAGRRRRGEAEGVDVGGPTWRDVARALAAMHARCAGGEVVDLAAWAAEVGVDVARARRIADALRLARDGDLARSGPR